MRHVAMLAAAVVMLTAIAVPAQGGRNPFHPLDTWNWDCQEGVVTSQAADDSPRERYLALVLDRIVNAQGGTELVDTDTDEGRGPLQVEVSGYVGDSEYGYVLVVTLAAYTRMHGQQTLFERSFQGWCQ